MNLVARIRLFRNLVACCLLVISLLGAPVAIVNGASIVTDEDIVGGGVNLQALKFTACAAAIAAGVSPLPPLCLLLGPEERFVFVTSTTSNGNLGGLAGADATCNTLASAAGLPGTYAAWLSTSTVNAKDRVGNHKWLRRDGVVVANDLADLTNGSINNAILQTEIGGTAVLKVWTGSNSAGIHDNGGGLVNTCLDWTSAAVGGFPGAIIGDPASTTGAWSGDIIILSCSSFLLPLYCFGL